MSYWHFDILFWRIDFLIHQNIFSYSYIILYPLKCWSSKEFKYKFNYISNSKIWICLIHSNVMYCQFSFLCNCKYGTVFLLQQTSKTSKHNGRHTLNPTRNLKKRTKGSYDGLQPQKKRKQFKAIYLRLFLISRKVCLCVDK